MKQEIRAPGARSIYNSDVEKYPLLKEKELLKLIHKAQQGDAAARDKVVCHNLRLVLYIVTRFYWGYREVFEDLVSCGNIGLLKAIDRYDPKFGTTFATYATIVIRQQVQRWVFDHSHTVRVPLSQHRKVWKLKKEMKAKNLSFQDMEQRDDVKLVTLQQAAYSMDSVSIDSSVRMGNDKPDAKTFASVIQTKDRPASEVVEGLDRVEKTNKFLATLPERSRQILIMRFGLDDGEPKTLDYIAEIYAISKERVRQLEEKALEKLREIPHSSMMKDLIA